MSRFAWSFIFAIALLVGCDSQTTSASSAESGAGNGATGGMQTVKGSGFRFQAPANWTVLPVSPGVGVASPMDMTKGIPGVPVSVGILPIPSPLKPADMIATLLKKDDSNYKIESESQPTVAGRTATKQVVITSSRINDTSTEMYVTRAITVYVPLDAGILAIQVAGEDAQVKSVSEQIESIIASIELE